MGWNTAFRIGADDIQQGATLGRLIGEKLHAKSLFVVDDHTTFGRGLAAEVLKVVRGKSIQVTHEAMSERAADYRALALKIKDADADVVFFGGEEEIGLAVLKALRATGSMAQFVAGDTMCDSDTMKAAEGAADNNYYCTVAGVPPSWLSAGIGFLQMYKARFGEPGPIAPVAYGGIHVLAQAMQRARSVDPKVYLEKLSRGSFDGKIQGAVEFDRKGDVKDGTVIVYKSLNGNLSEQRNAF
jgi:branched-chain amino acid transport system substrate-binding protein